MTPASILRIIALGLAGLLYVVPAARAEVTVTPELVCTVAHALRQPWSPGKCWDVATTLEIACEPTNLLAIAVLETGMRENVPHLRRGPVVADVGLMGVACRLQRGRCTNWPVRGLTVAELRDTRTNIDAATSVLAKKRRTCGDRALDCYVGDATGKSGRTADVAAIVAAFTGVEVQVKGKRVRELVRRIAAAVKRQQPRS